MIIYVDIDNTICITHEGQYDQSRPIQKNIDKVNGLFENGHYITYWTARGGNTGIDHTELTISQLKEWGCKYHKLVMNEKPSFDILLDDKAMNINSLI